MARVLIDSRIYDHPKYIGYGAAEIGLIVCAIVYCNRNRTDGVVPKNWPERRFGKEARRVVLRLVHDRVWSRAPKGNYVIVGFLDHNPSRADWLARRETLRRRLVPTTVRHTVILRDGLVCQICGDAVDEDDVHLDHIDPVARGGRSTADNLRVTHSKCNLERLAH